MDIDWDIAEISFKAGYDKCAEELEVYLLKWKKAGIKEVVEWIEKGKKTY